MDVEFQTEHPLQIVEKVSPKPSDSVKWLFSKIKTPKLRRNDRLHLGCSEHRFLVLGTWWMGMEDMG